MCPPVQVGVPAKYRPDILPLAHDHCLAGHLGIKETFDCVMCQVAGKPDQKIPVAPLRPIPAIHWRAI